MRRIVISKASWNEIAEALQKQGVETVVGAGALTIEKSDAIVQPHDYRSVGLRRDVATVAASVYKGEDAGFIDFTHQLYEYILNGKDTDNAAK